tara:strand:- start:392 stop:799 length:408 start_codon:yes stop_codon:yes gene_type:complete
MSNLELAEQVGLSPSPCLRRLRNLEASGAIRGYSADVDPLAYGLAMTAYLQIKLSRHNTQTVREFEDKVSKLPQVLECLMLTGDTDYLLKVLVQDLEGFERFIRESVHSIEGVSSVDTSFVYGTIKKTNVFPELD